MDYASNFNFKISIQMKWNKIFYFNFNLLDLFTPLHSTCEIYFILLCSSFIIQTSQGCSRAQTDKLTWAKAHFISWAMYLNKSTSSLNNLWSHYPLPPQTSTAFQIIWKGSIEKSNGLNQPSDFALEEFLALSHPWSCCTFISTIWNQTHPSIWVTSSPICPIWCVAYFS